MSTVGQRGPATHRRLLVNPRAQAGEDAGAAHWKDTAVVCADESSEQDNV